MACKHKGGNSLRIAASANMQYATEALIKEFHRQTGIPCEIIVGSSGKHTAQILEGAPYDVFLAADMSYPMELYKKGKAQSEPEVYAHGKLVLWSLSNRDSLELQDLLKTQIEHIAIANPKTAPYGKAATEVLAHHKVLDKIKAKLVYGESIAQINQFVYSGAAEVGFTSLSTIKSKKLQEPGSYSIIDSKSYTPIAQGIVILSTLESKLADANDFKSFILSAKGKSILKEYGYN